MQNEKETTFTPSATPEKEALPVMEMFHSLQGEGFHTGISAFFIRLGGCDVGCHWCDVKESWKAEDHPITSVSESIAEAEASGARNIIITGGEPLMYDLTHLTKSLRKNGFKLHLETSGAYPLTGEWDWICVSPKKFKAPNRDTLFRANELKAIIYNKDDFRFAEENAKYVNPDCVLFLQPEWSKRKEMLPFMMEYIRRNPGWRISLQTHKYIGIR